MTTIVLLHGAFRGAWAWDRVRPLLAGRGHRVVARDLPGAGRRFRAGAATIRLADHLEDIRALLDNQDLQDVVLVGHSQGGFLARAATEVVAPRVRLLAYLDAPVPRHGETAWSLLPGASEPPADLDPRTVIPPTPLTPGPGLDPADAEWINARLTPQGVAVSLDPVSLEDPDALALPERYAFCRHTPASYPSATTRARLDAAGTPYELLDAAHDAPVTTPAAVADWIDGCATSTPGGA